VLSLFFLFCLIKAGESAEEIQIGPGDRFRRKLKKSMNTFFRFGHRCGSLEAAEKGMAEFKIGGKIKAEFF
jgi:hypothetical protein